MTRGDFVYEGKAKKLYAVHGEPNLLWVEYKDDLTAFNAAKKGSFEGKGKLNFAICRLVFERLQAAGVQTHVREYPQEGTEIVEKLNMFALEVVVRNWLAGSTAKKFAIEEGTPLAEPLVEFYFKKDELNDPFISDEQALMLKVATREQLDQIKKLALKINQELKAIFAQAKIRLIDFKIEFGQNSRGEIVLGDEISPDSCRLWDEETLAKMDKDRFRRDLGQVDDMYREVLRRLTQVREPLKTRV